MTKIHNIFPTTIYEDTIPLNKNIKKQLIEKPFDNIYQNGKRNGYYSIDKYILNDEKILPLTEKIIEHTRNYIYNVYKVRKEISFFITNSWIMKHGKNDAADLHIHDNSLISGIYYLQTPKNSGDLFFKRNNAINPIFSTTLPIDTETNMNTWRINVKEGLLILFPSHLLHYTEHNLSDKLRYSLAFNMFAKGSFGNDSSLNGLKI